MTKPQSVNLTNKAMVAFIENKARGKPLEECLRYLMQIKKVGADKNVAGNVELCYLRRLFTLCEDYAWNLPTVYNAMIDSEQSPALFMRLRLALERSGVEFDSKDDKMIVSRIKSSKSRDFGQSKKKRRDPSMKEILSFSYFGDDFSLRNSLIRIQEALEDNGMRLPVETYLSACYLCFGALTFVFPVRPSTTGGITIDSIDMIEFDETNGVCYIDIESVKTRSQSKRAYPLWLGCLLQIVRGGRPASSSPLLFIRQDGIPYNEKNLRNLIMRKWAGADYTLYIGGNMRRRLLETVLQNDMLYNQPGTQQMVEHSRKVGQKYLLADTRSALLGLRSYIRGFLDQCEAYGVTPPSEFIEMVRQIKM